MWKESFLKEKTLAQDDRPTIVELYERFAGFEDNGWKKRKISHQTVFSETNETVQVPIVAFYNAIDVDWVLIAGIHGREPAGSIALSFLVKELSKFGENNKVLILPLLNPFGYYNHVRYGMSGESVSDSEHLLGRTLKPACKEADEITKFITNDICINKGAKVLDLHEDPVYEACGYDFYEWGSYLYIAGFENPQNSLEAKRIVETLKKSLMPLILKGKTRFNEELKDGMIINSPDGSIDELLANKGANPVITVENLLHQENTPALKIRVKVYQDVIKAFLGTIK